MADPVTQAPALEALRAALAALGTWGRPPDLPSTAAGVAAMIATLIVVTGRGRSILGIGPYALPRKAFLWMTAFSAALLSVGYIAFYLRGGPRIIDATTYFLQGRALSHGDFAWSITEPSGSFRGRFLIARAHDGQMTLGGIFPPGFPLLLALGFSLGAPMVVGPALAAGIVVATYRLARAVAELVDAERGGGSGREGASGGESGSGSGSGREGGSGRGGAGVEGVARLAALVSMMCGALRYHTADTMSHGASALGITLALDAALRRRALVAGLWVGAVVATRPTSALAIGLVVLVLLAGRMADGERRGSDGSGLRRVGRVALGVLPGVFLLLLAQREVTGSWWGSTQRMYYALSDGPPGCFRWGFGSGTGCLHEHGEFVSARLPHGYGLVEAVGTTLRRLRMHLLDVANFEPLALLVLAALGRSRGQSTRRSVPVLATLAVVVLHMIAYVPFYFDGNYPGGGARLFADVLPLEHVLLAVGVARLATPRHYVRAASALTAITLAGFAVHAAFEHEKLAQRDGGRPMFEPDLLPRSNVTNGLVFIDTDHGFALGHDPGANAKKGVVVARLRNDDRDRLLYERLERPPTYLYKLEAPPTPAAPATPPPTTPPAPAAAKTGPVEGAGSTGSTPAALVASIVPWTPPAMGSLLRFEAEAEWPPLGQSGGLAAPIFTEACATGARALALVPTPLAGRASATLGIVVPESGRYAVGARVVQGTRIPNAPHRGQALPVGHLRLGTARWDWIDVEGAACADLPEREVDLVAPEATLTFEAEGGTTALDKVTLKRVR